MHGITLWESGCQSKKGSEDPVLMVPPTEVLMTDELALSQHWTIWVSKERSLPSGLNSRSRL